MLDQINDVVSIIAGILSVVMFWASWREKNKCEEISKNIEQNINLINKSSSVQSEDDFVINHVGNFDNRKTIK